MEEANTPKNFELIKLTIEDCADITMICSKILRHGFDSYHPDQPDVNNAALLMKAFAKLDTTVSRLLDDEAVRREYVELLADYDEDSVWRDRAAYTQHLS